VEAVPAAVGTIKGMIGHTKAAAGVAGFIKAVMAVHEQVLPPTVGCFDPHPLLAKHAGGLRALTEAEAWPREIPLRAGVTAMGFGGINSHLVVEGVAERRTTRLSPRTAALSASRQDCELLLVDAPTPEDLRTRLGELAGWVGTVSYAQLADLAATLERELGGHPFRAAVVVSSPEEAATRLAELAETPAGTDQPDDQPDEQPEDQPNDQPGGTRDAPVFAADRRSFRATARKQARVGFLFPGQGSGTGTSGGALRRRLPEVAAVYEAAHLPTEGDMVATDVAQPRIVTGSSAGLRALALFGIEADVAVGHSLGELSALHWAGSLDEPSLLRVAAARGKAMAGTSASGTMAGINADADTVERLIDGRPVSVSGYNAPSQTVVAGPVEEVREVGREASEAGLRATELPVSHAFHSPLVAPAAEVFAESLADEDLEPAELEIVSTVTGESIPPEADLAALLRRQFVAPVLFAPALEVAAHDLDLLVEVGPGAVLTGLAGEVTEVPALALDTDSESLAGLLSVLGAAYTVGVPVATDVLFRGRSTKPLEVGAAFSFLASPAEQAPSLDLPDAVATPSAPTAPTIPSGPTGPTGAPAAPAETGEGAETGDAAAAEAVDPDRSTLEVLRTLVADRAELPPAMVPDDSRLLDDLHLSSITVGQVVNQAVQTFGTSVAQAPTNLATATLQELADLIDVLVEGGDDAAGGEAEIVTGAASWARCYAIDPVEVARPPARPDGENGSWQVAAGAGAFADSLRAALEQAGAGAGVLACLPERPGPADVAAALQGAQQALAGASGTRFVLVEHGDRGATGMAKTLHQEAPKLDVTVVRCAPSGDLVAAVVAEVAATTGFAEVELDAEGRRGVPTLRVLPVAAAEADQLLGPADVVLVSGGGKGITAECALAVAQDSGAKLALFGQPEPDDRSRRRTALPAGRRHRPGAGAPGGGGGGGRARADHRRPARRRPQRAGRPGGPGRRGAEGDLRAETRRAGRDAGRGRPRQAQAAGHVRQHHRPGRPVRRGALRHGERVAGRADRRLRRRAPGLPDEVHRMVGLVRGGHG
jgi:enediyne polyketide synthase